MVDIDEVETDTRDYIPMPLIHDEWLGYAHHRFGNEDNY